MTNQVAHPMMKFQRKIASLVEKKLLKPTDGIWKLALLYGDEWAFWKKELQDFGFAMHDPVQDVLMVDGWDEED